MTCVFKDGSRESFDLVVGCDGISSAVRRWVLQQETTTTTTKTTTKTERGNSGLRIQFGVAPAGQRPVSSEAGEMHQWFGDGAYALTATYGGVGGETYEMIALTTYDGSGDGEEEEGGAASGAGSSSGGGRDTNPNWDTAAVKDECLERLRAAGFPEEVTAVAAAATRFFDLGIGFQDPLVPGVASRRPQFRRPPPEPRWRRYRRKRRKGSAGGGDARGGRGPRHAAVPRAGREPGHRRRLLPR